MRAAEQRDEADKRATARSARLQLISVFGGPREEEPVRLRQLGALSVGLLLAAHTAQAETPEPDSLEIAVTDSTKAREPLPGVSLAVVPESASVTRVTGVTDSHGRWAAPVAPGSYRVTASLTGFKEASRLVVIPAADGGAPRPISAAFRLQVAEPSQAIVIDDTCAIDHLRDMGTWRICGRDLERLPYD